jgi:hypothetical protein
MVSVFPNEWSDELSLSLSLSLFLVSPYLWQDSVFVLRAFPVFYFFLPDQLLPWFNQRTVVRNKAWLLEEFNIGVTPHASFRYIETKG